MSTTRYAKLGADPDSANERYLASSKLRGIAIGLNIIVRVAKIRTQRERDAMLWLHGYSRLRDITADALCEELDMSRADIRAALTDPDADLTRFVRQVEGLRKDFEADLDRVHTNERWQLPSKFAEAHGPIADTGIKRKIENGFKMAMQKPQIIEVVGKTRTGKSIAARRLFLRNLHRAAWLYCPKPGNERMFLHAIAKALGCSFGTSEKNSQVEPKIMDCLSRWGIRMLFVDEGHRLWPNDIRTEPKRIEFLRDAWETQDLSVMIFATDQYSESLSAALAGNPRWAPGQWVGRVQTFHLPDVMKEADLSVVARHHAPEADPATIAQLVSHALSSEGYCGAMVNAIERARFRSDSGKVSLADVVEAQRQLDLDARKKAVASRMSLKPMRRAA